MDRAYRWDAMIWIGMFFLMSCGDSKELESRFTQEDFISINGERLDLKDAGNISVDCYNWEDLGPYIFRIDVLGIDSLILDDVQLNQEIGLVFAVDEWEDRKWGLHVPNPISYQAAVFTSIVTNCTHDFVYGHEGMVESRVDGDMLYIYIDNVLMKDEKLENDEECGFRMSGKMSCML